MDLKIINTAGSDAGVLTVDDAIFGSEYNEALIHQVVKSFMSNARSGNRAQKTRSEVAKSTRKPFKQKGTGRARAGMASSPLWRGGGRIFPNKPDENFTQKINRKMYRLAMSSIVSQLVRDERFVVADDLVVAGPKTRGFTQILKNMSLDKNSVLVVVDELTEDLFLSSRNLPNVLILEQHQVDPYSLLRCDKTVFVKKAALQLQERLV